MTKKIIKKIDDEIAASKARMETPNRVDAYDMIDKAVELKRKKSLDYQGSKFTEEEYFPLGDLSYFQMLHTKYMRIASVLQQEDTNFESLNDSLIDMINYSAMWMAYRENHGKD